MSYVQAILLGLLQGVTELFPVSSLGHSVVLPALLGWQDVVAAQSASDSYYLAFLVGLHVATALALLLFYWRTWLGIVRGVLESLRTRRIDTPAQRLGWLLIVATIPAGLAGIVLEHAFRVLFAVPLAAAAFLFVNGLILAGAELLRRRAEVRAGAMNHGLDPAGGRSLDSLAFREAGVIGVAQIFALLAGISRSGITMAAGLVRGLDHEDAARFSFLLSTPIILGAGVYKLPDLLGPNGDGVLGQVVAGSLAAGVAAYISVRFLTRYFTTRTLAPFAAYCLVVGAILVAVFASHAPQQTAPTPTPTGTLPVFDHVYLVVMENKGYESVVGASDAPYLNSLIHDYGLAANYNAIAHPSQPNYLALFSGATHGVTDDRVHDIAARNLADQLEEHGRSWRVFAENVPPDCFTGATASGGADGQGDYARKHEPAISFVDIATDPERCRNITDLSHFSASAADFELIVPNMCHDMHDCPVATGDAWLRSFVPRITSSPSFAHSVLFITWDEGTTALGGGGHIPTIIVSPQVAAGTVSTVLHDHYSLLRTIEDSWSLGCLARACQANDLRAVFAK